MVSYLYVYNEADPDYGVLEFEENADLYVVEVFNEMIKLCVRHYIKGDLNFKLKTFEAVDSKFEDFVKSELCDYDTLKGRNIYRIGNIYRIE